MRLVRLTAFMAGALAAVTGCASYPRTQPLQKYDLSAGYRFEQLSRDARLAAPPAKNSDDLFVLLAFSGGGTRAAALSYGVLRQLRDVTFHWDETAGTPVACEPADSAECRAKARSLLDEVDVISSVSGGSFTAAYYALNGSTIFDTTGPFHREFLYHPVQRDLFAQAVYYPSNWRRLRSRPEIAANLYAKHVFGDATFADLRARPYLILNATDMSTGARFEFTQEQFDQLCADLGPVALSRGVAASSAFPGLLNSLTIDSYNARPGGCGYTGPGTRPQDWVELALKDDPRSERHQAAQQLLAYRKPERRHLHLLDGGLADNIGARAILRGVGSTDRPIERDGNSVVLGGWSALTLLNQKRTKTVLIVIVNAKTNRTKDWDADPTGPGTFSVINVASGVPMGNFSRETLGRVRELLQEFFPTLNEADAPRLFGLEVAFDGLPTEAERAFFGSLGTNFDLDPYEVDCLIDRGGALLRGAPLIQPGRGDFTGFVRDYLKGQVRVPSGSAAVCTAEDARSRLAVRNHYLDVGVQAGIAWPGSDDVDSSRVSPGLTFRATRPHGFGVMVDVGPQTFPIRSTIGGQERRLGSLRLWSLLGGVGHTTLAGRAEMTVGVSAGVGFGSFSISPEAGDAFGRLGLFGLDADASNTWVVKPQATFWYNLTDRWAATVSASYVLGRPTVRIASGPDVPLERRMDAASVRVGAGIGFKIF